MFIHSINYTAVAIFLGLFLVAGAIYTKDVSFSTDRQSAHGVVGEITPARTSDAHIYGNNDAPIVIVEYSDFECPYCSVLHPTIKRIVDESAGSIKWEYRHLPLPMHPHAELAAVMSECVAKELGEEQFWVFTTTLFENQRSITPVYLETEALAIGVSSVQLADCRTDEDIANHIATDTAAAQSLGGNGTPFSVIVFADGTMKPVSGALPYEHWMSLLAS